MQRRLVLNGLVATAMSAPILTACAKTPPKPEESMPLSAPPIGLKSL